MKNKLKKALQLVIKNFELSAGEKSTLEAILERVEALESTAVASGDELALHSRLLSGEFDYVLYSDGACRGNPGPGSYGYLIQSLNNEDISSAKSYKLTTNNKMEMSGVIEGLKYLRSLNEKSVLVVSDSKYVINGMDSWVASWKARGWKKADKKSPENVELWKEMDALRNEFSKIEFEWVKGHSGHPQNEFCDRIANESLDEAGY